jgi:AcrR family transcriptional regulator
VSNTRGRILETAWELVREHGTTAVRMADVAEAAGVSRQLVYVYFDSRAGLLTAMARHHDARSGFAARVAAAHELPPREALEALLRAWLAYVPEILPVARALEAAAATGAVGAEAWEDRMADLRAQFRRALERLPDCTPDPFADGAAEAMTDWIWARSHVSDWQHLVVERGWAPEDYVERCVSSIMASLESRRWT